MTTDDVKSILKNHHDRLAVCTALACVNLSDKELNTLILRYMHGLTQEQTAEKLDTAVNSIYNWQQSALKKTAKMWTKLPIARILLCSL